MTWRGPYLDVRTGLFIPRLVTWDPETGEFTCVEGPKGFATWQEAEAQEGAIWSRTLSTAAPAPVSPFSSSG